MPDLYWTCPGCGLLCDDLRDPLSQSPRSDLDCARLRHWLTSLTPPTPTQLSPLLPTLEQQSSQLERALQQLQSARSILLWLGDTDVATARAAMALADTLHATVALDQDAQTESIHRYLCRAGQMTGTLGEIRARADLIVLLGNDWSQRTPRLRERLTPNPDSPGVFVDPYEMTRWFELKSDGRWVDLLAMVRQRISSKTQSSRLPFREDEELTNLADQLTTLCQTRRYIAWIWHEHAWGDAAESLLAELMPLVDQLNQTTRSLVLRLEDRPGLLTAYQVCTWQTGFAPPMAFTDHGPKPLEQLCFDAFDFALVVSDLAVPQYVPDSLPQVRLVPATAIQDPQRDIMVNTCGLHRSGYLQRGDMAWMLRIASHASPLGTSAAASLDWLRERIKR